MTPYICTRDQAKARAKIIRAEARQAGEEITHSAALERVAAEQGHPSWNAFSARLGNAPEIPLQVGDRVCGTYLKQAFDGVVLSVTSQGGGAAFDVVIEFDEAVDVVSFGIFNNFRRRIHTLISPGGTSFEKTSDGVPHMVVARVDDMVV